METNNIIIKQILNKKIEDDFMLAEKYYAFIAIVNNLSLTPRDLQLIAFTAVRGNMTYGNVRNDFCEKFKTTSATIGNIICKLAKLKILVKEKGIIKVNPIIALDFSKDLRLEINLIHE